MYKLIVEKELREIIGSTKFAVTFGVCAALIILAFYVGARNYEVSLREYESASSENVKQMEGLTDWNSIEHRIFLPPQPLAILVSGISNDVGRTIEMRTRGELLPEDSRFNEDPIFAVFRFLDLEFIFTVVLSLFAILFAYDAINGEKERGTLPLTFANSVPRDQYILGKVTGSFVALVVPLLIPILLGCILLPALGVPMRGGEWLRLGMVLLAGILYFGVFLTLSVLVSALTQRSSSSFLLLLVLWIFAVLIIPRTAVLVAGRAVEVPSIDQVNYEKNYYSRQLDQEFRKRAEDFFTQNMGRDDIQVAFSEFQTASEGWRAERDEQVRVFSDQLNENRRNRESVQQGITLGIARLSPAATFSLAAANLAATSVDLKASFQEAASVYQQNYAKFMEEKTGSSGGFVMRMRRHGMEEEEQEVIDPLEIPVFEYEMPAASELIESSLMDLGFLFLFNIIFFISAFVAFLRYDLR